MEPGLLCALKDPRVTRMKNPFLVLGLASAVLLATTRSFADQEQGGYEIVHHGTPVLGHFWVGDGVADVGSSNNSVGNRFQFGAQAQFGPDYRFLVGWTLFDMLSSGESTPGTGSLARTGIDFDFGIFVIPQTFWIEYSLYLGEVRGNAIGGHVNTTGQSISTGYRFYDKDKISVALELSYLHITSETLPIYNFATQQSGTAYYPFANVWALSLRAGFDVGGR
jgi:hypothetical protein